MPARPGALAPPCLLSVHAHPDDEASKGAPTVARYAADGVRCVLVCCTGGEEGDLQNPALAEPGGPLHGLEGDALKAALAAMRPLELDRSRRAIGYDELVMLGYRDSGMAGTPPNEHPESFAQADLDEAVGRLVAVLRRERPQVILTYGDDQQGYPHPDHLRVHDISVLAYERAGDPMWYPEAGEPWQPSKLYYTAWSRSRMVAVHERLLASERPSPYDEKWFDRPSQDHRITTKLAVGGFLEARSAALLAHATQVDPKEGFWFALGDAELAEVYPWDDWILARSAVADEGESVDEGGGERDEGELEDDLFAGVDVEIAVARPDAERRAG